MANAFLDAVTLARESRPDYADEIDRMVAAWVENGDVVFDEKTDRYICPYTFIKRNEAKRDKPRSLVLDCIPGRRDVPGGDSGDLVPLGAPLKTR